MRRLLLLALPVAASALTEVLPFPELYELRADADFRYSQYPRVASKPHPVHHSSNDEQLFFRLGGTPAPEWDIEGELEFANTHSLSWRFRSAALQGRYLLLDQILKGPVSLAFPMIVRGVSPRTLRDFSTPYAATWNFEVGAAVDHEWTTSCDHGRDIFPSLLAILYAGQGTRGLPWLRGTFDEAIFWGKSYLFAFTANALWGFGERRHLVSHKFKGYGPYKTRALDLGLRFTQCFSVYGSLTVKASYRPYARTYPKNFFAVEACYVLPFSAL